MSARRNAGPGDWDLAKRQADRSDVRHGYDRFAKPDPASSSSQSKQAPALHALEYLTTPVFQIYPFRFAHARPMRLPSVGA